MVAGTGFEPMTSRLCLPSTAFAALDTVEICGLDYTFTFLRFPLVLGACHLVSTPSLSGLARYYRLTGSTEFDRLSAN
jgi:hypothetical protein